MHRNELFFFFSIVPSFFVGSANVPRGEALSQIISFPFQRSSPPILHPIDFFQYSAELRSRGPSIAIEESWQPVFFMRDFDGVPPPGRQFFAHNLLDFPVSVEHFFSIFWLHWTLLSSLGSSLIKTCGPHRRGRSCSPPRGKVRPSFP